MARRAVTKEEGEMLMRLALSFADELTDEQVKRAVQRWTELGDLNAAEFETLIGRVNKARKELGLD